MPFSIEIKNINAASTAYKVNTAATMEESDRQLRIILPEVYQYLSEKGVTPAGKPFVRYVTPERVTGITIEAGVAVTQDFAETKEIRKGQLPGGMVVSTLVVGPYEILDDAHDVVNAWIDRNRKQRNGGPWNLFIDDSRLVASNFLRTEVYYPIK